MEQSKLPMIELHLHLDGAIPPETMWALAQFSLPASELLMVDDLKPGYDMARAAGVDFAAAGWAYDVPEIEAFMRKNCDFYFKTVQEFRTFLEED